MVDSGVQVEAELDNVLGVSPESRLPPLPHDARTAEKLCRCVKRLESEFSGVRQGVMCNANLEPRGASTNLGAEFEVTSLEDARLTLGIVFKFMQGESSAVVRLAALELDVKMHNFRCAAAPRNLQLDAQFQKAQAQFRRPQVSQESTVTPAVLATPPPLPRPHAEASSAVAAVVEPTAAAVAAAPAALPSRVKRRLPDKHSTSHSKCKKVRQLEPLPDGPIAVRTRSRAAR